MKTYVIPTFRHDAPGRGAAVHRRKRFAIPFSPLLATLAAVLPAAAVAVLAVLGFGAANPGPAAAALWVTGFAFFALAVESRGQRAALLGLTAAALMLLAGLSTAVSPEFGVLAGLLVAAWIAVAVLVRMLHLGGGHAAA